MAEINNILHSVIMRSNDFCCLCLKDKLKHLTLIEDEILVDGVQSSQYFGNLLAEIVGKEIFGSISIFGTVCDLCTKEAINCYNFIQTVKENCKKLEKTIEKLANSIHYVNDNLESSKTLFIKLNSCEQMYDSQVYTKSCEALKQFKNLNENVIEIKKENIKSERDDKTYLCIKCNLSFTTEKLLKTHLTSHVDQNFKCNDCNKVFVNLNSLNMHKTSHISFICTVCGKVYLNKRTLDDHEAGHSATIVCHDCGRIYKNKNTYKKHIEHNICSRKSRAPPTNGKYICDYCNKRYTQKMSLRVHIQYEHLNYKAHECKYCKKKFWAQSRLKMHMIKHTKYKAFTCTTCNRKFVTKESLLYHTRIHTGEKPYECHLCGEKFLSASRRLLHHKKEHIKETFECMPCHIQFSSKYRLQKHIKLKHASGMEVVNNFQIPENEHILQENVNIDGEMYFDVYDVIEDDIQEILGQ